jgi:hypothetical protein
MRLYTTWTAAAARRDVEAAGRIAILSKFHVEAGGVG